MQVSFAPGLPPNIIMIVKGERTEARPADATSTTSPLMWLPNPSRTLDLYAEFTASIEREDTATLELRILGAHWYRVTLDGEFLTDGPPRFEKRHPEYEVVTRTLGPGSHTISAIVHNEGVSTRILRGDIIPPFLFCEAFVDGNRLEIKWHCREITAYEHKGIRINPQLGWIEWCDARRVQALRANQKVAGSAGDTSGSTDALPSSDDFHDEAREWSSPALVPATEFGDFRPVGIGSVSYFPIEPTLLEQGALRGDMSSSIGSSGADLQWAFMQREHVPDYADANGTWALYDLGKIGLYRPRISINAPAGTPIIMAYAERLTNGRVSPYIPLSCGPSCNLDYYIAPGGQWEFGPIGPRGMRYLEVHIGCPTSTATIVHALAEQRSYFGEPIGSFQCSDPLLNRVWRLGIDTLRGCTEDAIIDNPTRERGQWTGDVVTVGGDIVASAYNDMRLIRRGLVQSAWCSQPNGVVAGLCPGGETYVSTYALQWVAACWHYYEITGDRPLLEEMFSFAERNLEAFEKEMTDEGLQEVEGTWKFIDWGYQPDTDTIDLAYNAHYLLALDAMIRWADLIAPAQNGKYTKIRARLADLLSNRLHERVSSAPNGWNHITYHAAVLALHAGLVRDSDRAVAVARIKSHMMDCFPNNPHCDRLTHPEIQSRHLITPYFAHYAFPPLIEMGEGPFAFEQIRTCWGYALEEGRTTMIEVFNENWSHCHQWACCPTWQMSRYGLGLHPRYDLGHRHFELKLIPGRLEWAEGTVPLSNETGSVKVEWKRNDGTILYNISPDQDIYIHLYGQPPRKISSPTTLNL